MHTFLLTAYKCFRARNVELSSRNRGHNAHEPIVFTIWPFEEKSADPEAGVPQTLPSGKNSANVPFCRCTDHM